MEKIVGFHFLLFEYIEVYERMKLLVFFAMSGIDFVEENSNFSFVPLVNRSSV